MRTPRATYRLQFGSSFPFRAAKDLVAYLSDVGISDIYASPIFKARKGSGHGYDVVDPNQLNPELGSEEDLRELLHTARSNGIGWIQDVVPNHMAYDAENHMLMDILESGHDSPYFGAFDIDWEHQQEGVRGKVLAPFLGNRYGECLENGEIQLGYDDDGFSIRYYEHKFPIKIESYPRILSHRLHVLRKRLGEENIDFARFLGILYTIRGLSSPQEAFADRYDQIKIVKRLLLELHATNPEIKRFLEENLELFNGNRGNPHSFDILDRLLSAQRYRLSFWKVATEEINYRRFFNINGLISLRIEAEEVFERMHTLVLRLIGEFGISGLRIDHIDGLYDPAVYLKRLHERAGDVYTVAEKILAPDEQLPLDWPIQGTTGYDFLNYVNGIFCDRTKEAQLTRIFTNFTGFETPYDDLVYEKKKLILERHMTGDVDNLSHLLKRVSSSYRHASDISLHSLQRVIVEVLALFPVYRTYLSDTEASERDRTFLSEALKRARQKNPDLVTELDFLEEFFLFHFGEHASTEQRSDWIRVVMRFQQLTGPLMAKGFEDTTLYLYNRLISLNEVGGEPRRLGFSTIEFHQFNIRRAEFWPHSVNGTSTHDSKRGEDVRARINVLSEIPQPWGEQVNRWSRINESRKDVIDGRTIPDANDEYLFYQTLLGAYPFDDKEHNELVKRIKEYMIKVVREAKVHTAWIAPDTIYEEALLQFVDRVLEKSDDNQFLLEFVPFQRKVARYGMFNSLSQTLLKITCPGVPDFYQGSELWDLNLVDPDNRRPVDFHRRQKLLRSIQKKEDGHLSKLLQDLLKNMEDGKIKLFLIHTALMARRENIALFQDGDYVPLAVKGRHRKHILAFSRNLGNSSAVTVVPLQLASLIKDGQLPVGEEVWGDTTVSVPDDFAEWLEVFGGRTIRGAASVSVGDLLERFPVALLLGERRTTPEATR